MDRINANLVSWCRRSGGLVGLTCSVILLSSASAAAQGASIIGRLTDQSGGVLPGVTVTTTSPALQVSQVTATTNEQGDYRLAPLPIGVYALTFELPGFQTVRNSDVRLTVGFTARVDAAMNVASLEQQVTVSGTAPVVDVTSTSSTTVLTRELLELTPTSRHGLSSLLVMAPATRTNLDVGGNTLVETVSYRAFAQSGDAWVTLEGVALGGRTTGVGGGHNIDYNSIEEASVQSVATDASSPTRGIQVAAIVKSGGNNFHGAAHWGQSNKNFQSNNIDEQLKAIGITKGNALENRYDLSGDLGGRIVRDKLWFYGAARTRYEEQAVLGSFKPDGSPANAMFRQYIDTEKLSYQASSGLRFVGFHQRQKKTEVSGVTELIDYLAREDASSVNHVYKIEGQSILTDSLVASLQVGTFSFVTGKKFNTGDTLVGREDLGTLRKTGEPYSAGENRDEGRTHTRGYLTWHKSNWVGGNHEVKAGFDHAANRFGIGFPSKKLNYRLLYINGVPEELVVFNNNSDKAFSRQNYLGLYVADSLTIGRRLTLNLGARLTKDAGFVPAHCQEAANSPGHVFFSGQCTEEVQLPTWNSVSPRLRMAYDLFGDGRTAIKGGWGRYERLHNVNGDITQVNRQSATNAHYRWRDVNGNNDYDSGEVNLAPNGTDFLRTTGLDMAALTPRAVPNPDHRQTKIDEFSLSIEREVIRNFAVRLTGVHSVYHSNSRIQNNLRPYETYNIPVTNRDPGPDNSLGTADDGGLVTYYEFPSTLTGARFEELMLVNSPNNSKYTGFDIAGTKRLANGWQFQGSYTATKKNEPPLGALNPNTEINTAIQTWEWDSRLSGSYAFPFDLVVSSQFEHRSGVEFARQVLFRGGRTIPSLAVNVEPIGTQRRPNINLVSFRAEKSFRLTTAHRLAVRLNLYNALNANTVTNSIVRAGATFLRPTAILPPRIAEVSASYTF